MRRYRPGLLALVVALSVHEGPVPLPAAAAGAGVEVHGADAVFAGRGVAIAWGVLRGADEAAATVVIRVIPRDAAFRAVAVDLVDPFAGSRVTALAPASLERGRAIRIPRSRFAEHPRAEIRLAGSTEALVTGAPALTVYFTGVPDATPEFSSEAALGQYLESALARAVGR